MSIVREAQDITNKRRYDNEQARANAYAVNLLIGIANALDELLVDVSEGNVQIVSTQPKKGD